MNMYSDEFLLEYTKYKYRNTSLEGMIYSIRNIGNTSKCVILHIFSVNKQIINVGAILGHPSRSYSIYLKFKELNLYIKYKRNEKIKNIINDI